jgi:hypothetical protein
MPLKSTKTHRGDIFDVSMTRRRKRLKNRVYVGMRFCGFARFAVPAFADIYYSPVPWRLSSLISELLSNFNISHFSKEFAV